MAHQVAYMAADYVGTATRRCYAKQGDLVEVVSVDYSGMALVKNNGILFHVKFELLSSETFESAKQPDTPLMVQEKSPPTFREQTRKNNHDSNQQTLF